MGQNRPTRLLAHPPTGGVGCWLLITVPVAVRNERGSMRRLHPARPRKTIIARFRRTISASASLPMRRPSFGLWHRRNLVDHQSRGRLQPVALLGFDRKTQQRSLGRIAREGADRNGLGRVEAIVLHDHDWTRLARIVRAASRRPNLTAPHSSLSIEIASMKASSLAACRLDATSRDCIEASLANWGERVSGTHTWMGRRPCARRRSR